MVVSKPCKHPECPPREGFIRGEYESVEFIREIPSKGKIRKSSSAGDIARQNVISSLSDMGKEAAIRNAKRTSTFPMELGETEGKKSDYHTPTLTPTDGEKDTSEGGRRRGRTISFAESRGQGAKGELLDVPHGDEEDPELNPVEWIMITRSDPGGNVPRWM